MLKNNSSEFAKAIYEKNDFEMAMIAEKLTDPNFTDEKGWTPVIHAGYWGMTQTVRVLTERGADPDIKTPDGYSALIYAVESGNIYTVRALLEAGADPNITNGEGWTPLIWASALGFYNIAAELLKNGADISIRNDQKMTALDIARLGHQEYIESLLENHILQQENLLPIGAADCPVNSMEL